MKKLIVLVLSLLSLEALAQTTGGLQQRTQQLSFVRGSAAVAVAEATDLTAVADSSGSLAGTYFVFYDALDAHKYCPWYKVSGTGTAPAVSGCTNIEIDIATNDTDATVAGASRTAISTATTGYITVTGATTHIILTNVYKGASTDVADTGSTGFSISKTADGVSAQTAISSGSVVSNMIGWQICNDAVNTSTWLAVGQSSTAYDAVVLDKGECLVCPSCTNASLKAAKVSSQAASNGYSVIQFK